MEVETIKKMKIKFQQVNNIRVTPTRNTQSQEAGCKN